MQLRSPAGTFLTSGTLCDGREGKETHNHMLRWAILFLILGLIAGALGFTSIAGASIAIAKFLFFVFLAVFIVLLFLGVSAARGITR